jgi:DNA-binding transcriptional regulator YiaG
MLTSEQKEASTWKAAVLAGISSAGFAMAPPSLNSTGAIHLADNQMTTWDESSIVDAFAENYQRLQAIFSGEFGSGAAFRLNDCVVESVYESTESSCAEVHIAKSPSEWIAEIRAALRLQIKELAEIIGVRRPTVYAWIKGDALPQKHNQSRIRVLHRIASAWSRLSTLPANSDLRALDDDGRSIIDDLKADRIPESMILDKLRAIAARPMDDTSERRKSILELAQERGMDLAKVRSQSEVVDAVTGKRASME